MAFVQRNWETKQLLIQSQNLKGNYTSRDGTRSFQIYNLRVADPQGNLLDAQYKSFNELPVGVLQEFEVSKEETAEHGVQYTVRVPKPKLGPKLNWYESRLIALEQKAGIIPETLDAFVAKTKGAAPREAPFVQQPAAPPQVQPQAAPVANPAPAYQTIAPPSTVDDASWDQ